MSSPSSALLLLPPPFAVLPPLLLLSFSSLARLASSRRTASLDLLAAASTDASTLPSDRLRSEASSSPPGWSRDEAAIASEPSAMEPSVAATAKPAVWLCVFCVLVFGFRERRRSESRDARASERARGVPPLPLEEEVEVEGGGDCSSLSLSPPPTPLSPPALPGVADKAPPSGRVLVEPSHGVEELRQDEREKIPKQIDDDARRSNRRRSVWSTSHNSSPILLLLLFLLLPLLFLYPQRLNSTSQGSSNLLSKPPFSRYRRNARLVKDGSVFLRARRRRKQDRCFHSSRICENCCCCFA